MSPAPSSRRSRAMQVLVPVAVVVALAALWMIATTRPGVFGAADDTRSAPSSTLPERLSSVPETEALGRATATPDDAFRIAVEYVIDGDTIKARAIDPSEVMPEAETVSVRLIGIDTPETYPDEECWGIEATGTLRMLAPEGSTLWAAPDAEWRDRYDRVLLYLWTADGTFVNRELVVRGDAESLRVEPNDSFAEVFAADESAARTTGAGQWGACG